MGRTLVPTRYVVALLGCVGMGIIYGMRVNLNVAIVTMVNHTALAIKHQVDSAEEEKPICATANETDDEVHPDGPFIWTNKQQGLVLSSFFIGYCVSQFPGGRIAEVFSAKWVMFFAIAISLIATLLLPVLATIHFGGVVFLRILIGIGAGVTFPTMHVLLAHWSPPLERSFMGSVVYSGTAMGTVIFMLVSGLIAGHLGWEYVFYIEASVCSIWLLLWYVLVSDYPQNHKFISEEEREYIMSALHQSAVKKKLKVPWKALLCSKPFWAVFICNSCVTWGWYMLQVEIPTYMKAVLDFKIRKSAWVTALPFFSMWLFTLVLSRILDILRTKKTISTTMARKIATWISSFIPAGSLVALCYIGCNKTLGVLFMTLGVTGLGGMFCGVLTNHIDIAPNFAGTLMALTNTVGTIPGIVVPNVVSALVENDPSINSWRIAFYSAVAGFLLEALVFTVWGSGEEQEWNNPEPEETTTT